jgi:hypothetical protein
LLFNLNFIKASYTYNSYNTNHIGANTKKNFFNAASNGMLTELKEIVSKYPILLKIGNRNSDELAIFYSIRNRQVETTLYLLEMGQSFDITKVHRAIYNSNKPNLTYHFFLEINNRKHIFGTIDGQDFENWLFIRCKQRSYMTDNITSIEKLMELKGISDWRQILNEYKEERKNATGPRAKQTIRDLTLKYLLDEL